MKGLQKCVKILKGPLAISYIVIFEMVTTIMIDLPILTPVLQNQLYKKQSGHYQHNLFFSTQFWFIHTSILTIALIFRTILGSWI